MTLQSILESPTAGDSVPLDSPQRQEPASLRWIFASPVSRERPLKMALFGKNGVRHPRIGERPSRATRSLSPLILLGKHKPRLVKSVRYLITSIWFVRFGGWWVRFATRLIVRRYLRCLLLRGRVFSPTPPTNDNAPLHIRMQLAVVSYRP
jgi:hypothetical protein